MDDEKPNFYTVGRLIEELQKLDPKTIPAYEYDGGYEHIGIEKMETRVDKDGRPLVIFEGGFLVHPVWK
jgi:hypothetical protein